MIKKFKVFEVGKEPYGVFITVATYEDAERVVQEDIKLEKKENGYDYTEDDYFINPVEVSSYEK